MSESALLSFARDCGLNIRGVVKGEPGEFHARGWLSADGRRDKDLLFHPFRIYVLAQLLQGARNRSPEKVREVNGTADLAILLEPVYWPYLTDHGYGTTDYEKRYRRRVLKLVRSRDAVSWARIHNSLRIEAAGMDPNHDLYVLLRLSLWERRRELRGRLSGALWIRHIAEVIRRGFEEAHCVQWPEEDQAFGHWRSDARIRVFGLERPFHNPLRSKPFIAYRFGLFTGSALRWYVEGETEYYAIRHLLPEPEIFGVEIVNLRGEIACERRNSARKLEDALKEDMALRRFSVISFDRDSKANERAIRRQIEQDHIVGSINANDPDFEFENFSLEELVEIAAQMDERLGFDGRIVRTADWTGVHAGRAFADRYSAASHRHCSPKGQDWGEELAEYAAKHPSDPRTGTDRAFLRTLSAVCWAWNSNYAFQKGHFTFDTRTLEAKRR
jgi:hypothetical protein